MVLGLCAFHKGEKGIISMLCLQTTENPLFENFLLSVDFGIFPLDLTSLVVREQLIAT